MSYALSMGYDGLTSDAGKRKALLFGLFFLFYVLVNASISLRMGMHWDEMIDIDGSNTGEYVAAGRWGLALYRTIFGSGAYPLLAPLVAGAFICLSLVWQVDLLRLRGRFLALFYGGMYLSSIQWAYQLEYSHQCDALALGILLSTAGAACVSRQRGWAGVALLLCGMGMYQSMILYAAALLLLLCLSTSAQSHWTIVRYAACIAAACAGYCVINALALHLPWVGEDAVLFQHGYQMGMSRWSEFPLHGDGREQCQFLAYYGIRFAKMTLKNMLGLSYGGQWVFATVIIPVAGLIRHGWGMRRLSWFLGLLLLWWLPFCLILPTFSDQGARVSLAEPLVLAGIWGLFLRECSPRHNMKYGLLLFMGLALLKSAYRVADIAVNESYVYQSNLACVREMHTRGTALAEAEGMDNAFILLVGDAPFDPELTWSRGECLGERGYIPPKMLSRYCRFMHIERLRYATPDEAAAHDNVYRQMPTWPASGSVRHSGSDIIIRVD